MSVQSEIARLSNAKADIASAIAEKGIEVPVGTMIDEMADLIRLIKAGSSVSDEILLTMTSVDPTVFVVSGGTVSFNYLPGTTLIVWGDGAMEEFDPSILTKDNIVTHTYATTGIYTVKVYNAQTIPKYFAMAMSNGKELRGMPAAKAILADLQKRVDRLSENGIIPKLTVVRVGAREDDLSYERGIYKRFEGAGAKVETIELPLTVTQDELEEVIEKLNKCK